MFESQDPDILAQFEQLGLTSESDVKELVARTWYNDFELTQAVRPAKNATHLEEGFVRKKYADETGSMPVLVCAATKQKIFDLFLELLDPLGDEVVVVLESSHHQTYEGPAATDFFEMDRIVLKSMLAEPEYENMLLNDGCAGIAVFSNTRREVQLDEHKLLYAYGRKLRRFRAICERYGLSHKPNMKCVSEEIHMHSTSQKFLDTFRNLTSELQSRANGRDFV